MRINFLKIVLSIILIACLLDMPYWYYQLVRFVSMLSFLYLAYVEYEENKQKNIAVVWVEKQTKYTPLFLYIALAILFQPFIKIALGRNIWNIVDVIVSVFLLISIFINNKKLTK